MRRLVFLVFIVIVSCQQDPGTYVAEEYFDLPRFTGKIITAMASQNGAVSKTFILNDKSETKELVKLDSAFWANELKYFLTTDFNNPKYINSIEFSKRIPDSSSNLFIHRITRIEDDIDLNKFELYFLDTEDDIRMINLVLDSKNLLTSSKIEVTVWFNEYQDILLLDSLVFVGRDKVLFQKERLFESHVKRILN